MIFGTQTTIDAGTYPRLLGERGIEAARIVSQACPGLADTISEDREGSKTAAEIRRWVAAALEKNLRRDTPVVACLACTHYGYRRDQFADAFAEVGVTATVINPNERAAGDLFPGQDSTMCSGDGGGDFPRHTQHVGFRMSLHLPRFRCLRRIPHLHRGARVCQARGHGDHRLRARACRGFIQHAAQHHRQGGAGQQQPGDELRGCRRVDAYLPAGNGSHPAALGMDPDHAQRVYITRIRRIPNNQVRIALLQHFYGGL